MKACKDCKYFTPQTAGHLGSCEKWTQGYAWSPDEIAVDGVVVEGDEGWGAHMGPEFGCILWAVR